MNAFKLNLWLFVLPEGNKIIHDLLFHRKYLRNKDYYYYCPLFDYKNYF